MYPRTTPLSWSRESLASTYTNWSVVTTSGSSMIKKLDDCLDYRPHLGEILWVRDRHVWKLGIISSEMSMYKAPGKFGYFPAYHALMLDMKTKEFTESYFVPMFGEVKPKDEYVTALLIEAGVIPDTWDYGNFMVMCQMEKMRRKLPK